jgi:hypothetical protein
MSSAGGRREHAEQCRRWEQVRMRTVLCEQQVSSAPGVGPSWRSPRVWRWAPHSVYVLLGIHFGGVEEDRRRVGTKSARLADSKGKSGGVSRVAGADGV